MQQHSNDGDWTCDECPHQTNSYENLKEHLTIMHHNSRHIEDIPAPFKCKFCEQTFRSEAIMEKHKHQKHKTFKPCKNIPQCPYEDKCIFNHNKIDPNMFLCFECGQQFKTFSDLMFHRKKEHTVNQCLKYSENKCKYTNDGCWYNHTRPSTQKDQQSVGWKPTTPVQPSVFQVPPANLAPPSPQPTQAMWLRMISMINDLNVMMKQLQANNQSLSL